MQTMAQAVQRLKQQELISAATAEPIIGESGLG